MNTSRLLMFFVVSVISLVLVGAALAADNLNLENPPTAQNDAASVVSDGKMPNEINSLAGSYVVFDPSVGGDTCYVPGAIQTFCFKAETFTTDWQYVYYLWEKFPQDWTITDVHLQGYPSCSEDGGFSQFSWSFDTDLYEVRISHERRMDIVDDCIAYYCFDVRAGGAASEAPVSWYWYADHRGDPPHHACSNDQYTPASQQYSCDEAIRAPAIIPACPLPDLFLSPSEIDSTGCNSTAKTHTISLYNNTGSNNTFTLSYDVTSDNGVLSGPDQIFASAGEAVYFDVTVQPNQCSFSPISSKITAASNGHTASSSILSTIDNRPKWETRPNSAPPWAGYSYVRDGCFARAANGDWMAFIMGDRFEIIGFWGYNITTNVWSQLYPEGVPTDILDADWAYDAETNLCYLTGGADLGGVGIAPAAYKFDPVGNSFQRLADFTSLRTKHNSWIGNIDGIKYLCIGGGILGYDMVLSTQCYDLSQAAPGVWSAENSEIEPYPMGVYAAADGTYHSAAGDQFWVVGGSDDIYGGEAGYWHYWDSADHSWHTSDWGWIGTYAGGDFFNGDFYLIGGSNFSTFTNGVVRFHFNGYNWIASSAPSLNNPRSFTIAGVADGTLWSIDGRGERTSNYVEKLVFCPECLLPYQFYLPTMTAKSRGY